MKISGVAIGQWNQICKKKEGIRRTTYKIHRAIVMGKVTLKYPTGDYIVRYHDLNLLVSKAGIVYVVWRDIEAEKHTIKDKVKMKYVARTTHKENIKLANERHRKIVKNVEQENHSDIYKVA